MSVVSRAFDLAQEIAASDGPRSDQLDAWMQALEDEGLRYCPLAEELLLGECADEEEGGETVFILQARRPLGATARSARVSSASNAAVRSPSCALEP